MLLLKAILKLPILLKLDKLNEVSAKYYSCNKLINNLHTI